MPARRVVRKAPSRPAKAAKQKGVAAAAPAAPVAATCAVPAAPYTGFDPSATLEDMRGAMRAFAVERDWTQYHGPRNLLLALTGEVGEVCELLQWVPDEACRRGLPGWDDARRAALGEELADVAAYLVLLADSCSIDLATAFRRKLEKSAAKYPADVVRGSSKKYTEYKQAAKVANSKNK